MGDENPKRNQDLESSPSVSDRDLAGGASARYTQWITRREREIPHVSGVWLTAGFASGTFAAGVVITASTIPKAVAIGTSVLWTIAASFSVIAVICFIAHWDVNRGRKVRHSEIEEERRSA